MIIKIAWLNIWRSKLRSLVVISAIIVGIWAGIFLVAFSLGMNNQRTKDALESSYSHIQIHNPQFYIEPKIEFWLNDFAAIQTTLDTAKALHSYSQRVILNGMISSATTATGAKIWGVNPQNEENTTNVAAHITEGTWFEDTRKNQIVIGQKLAEKHHLKLKSKIVLSFQDEGGDIQTGLFRVGGIFKSINSKFDERNIFTRDKDIFNILGITPKYHEVAILMNQVDKTDAFSSALAKNIKNNKISTWKELAPELAFSDEMMSQFLYVFLGIIMLALMFGIVNNMLMAILERKRELGMLMAIGLNKTKIFSMILIETVFLGLVGGPLGILAGYVTVAITSMVGIDLSAVSKGLSSLGMSTMIYPELETKSYFIIGLMVVITTFLASLYPAYKALKLNPVDTIRTAN